MSLETLTPVPPQFRRPPRYQPMVLCVLTMIGGIAFDCWFDCDFRAYLATAAAALIGWYGLRVVGFGRFTDNRCSNAVMDSTIDVDDSIRRRESLASTFLLIGLCAVTAFWHHGRWNWFGPHEIGSFAHSVAEPCCVEAVALTEPRWLAPTEAGDGLDYQSGTVRTRVTIRVRQIRNGQIWQPATGKLDLIIHAPTMHFRAGDNVRVFGKLAPIGPPTNPGQFDFQSFYRATERLATLHSYYPECVQITQPAGWLNSQALSLLRHKLDDLTWHYLNADEAAFASAILLGNREQLSPERREQFLQTGTVHLLAISGLHVGILAGSFFLLFRLGWVSRRNCLYATIGFVIFYAWLVEFRPPVSRAAILIVLYCAGRILGEKNFSYNLLAIAGLIVLIINPCDLFSLGCQLSFLAVGALNFGKDWVFWRPSTDPILRLIANTRPFHVRTFFWMGRNLRAAFLVSGLIWGVALPLVAFRFHLVAPVALIVNPLLLVPIAWALYGGLGVMIFGWFLPQMAFVCGKFSQWNLWLVEWMIGVAQDVPLSHFWTSGPTMGATTLFYIGLFFSAVFPPTRLRLKWIMALAIGWAVFGWIVPDQVFNYLKRHQSNPLICTFIDVGHGTSVLIQMPDGKNILYDAGSFGSSNYGFRNVAGVLWNQRIDYLDAIVISHADTDHFNAVPELSRRFSIREVVVSPQMRDSQSHAVGSVFKLLEDETIPVRIAFASPSTFVDSDAGVTDAAFTFAADRRVAGFSKPIHGSISILSPPAEGTGGSDNSDSIVLLIEHAGKKILLPGDLEAAGMRRLLSATPIDTSLVMAPHHGSINSDPTEFMKWSDPGAVVISGGNHRIKEEVVEIFRQNGRAVFRTDQHGAIRFRTDESGSTLQRWDRDHWQD